MKQIIFLVAIAVFISACGKNKTKQTTLNAYEELMEAVKTNDDSTFDNLISQVFSIDTLLQDSESGNLYTLLGYACKYKRCDIAEKLIDLGADIETGGEDDYFAAGTLEIAIEAQDTCLVKLLLNHGADVNRPFNEDGYSSLSLSCHLNNYEISKLLIRKGAKVDGLGDYGFDYIHYPLLDAVKSNNLKLVQLLIDNGCKVEIRNKQDETPFDIAEQNNNTEISDLLFENLLIQRTFDRYESLSNKNTKEINVEGKTYYVITDNEGYPEKSNLRIEDDEEVLFDQSYDYVIIEVREVQGKNQLPLTFISGKYAIDIDFQYLNGEWIAESVISYLVGKKQPESKININLTDFAFGNVFEKISENREYID